MSEDRLLHDLGHLAREEQGAENARLDERWDRLSAGTLTPEEEAELRALAATSPEAGEAYEAFRPLGTEFQARVVQSIRDQGLPTAAEPATVKPPGKLLAWPRHATRVAGWGAATAAAAATLVVLLRPPAPLPGYTLDEITGGSRAMRGEAKEVREFAPGDPFQVVLRPATEVTRARSLEAQCFLRYGRELHRLEVESQLDPRGSVKLKGLLDRDLRPGT